MWRNHPRHGGEAPVAQRPKSWTNITDWERGSAEPAVAETEFAVAWPERPIAECRGGDSSTNGLIAESPKKMLLAAAKHKNRPLRSEHGRNNIAEVHISEQHGQ